MDIHFHFIRDMIVKNLIEVEYIESRDHLADIFSKPLRKQQFHYLRN